MAGEESPRPGRPGNNWAQYLDDDLRVFEDTKGSTETSTFRGAVGVVLWPMAVKKSRK